MTKIPSEVQRLAEIAQSAYYDGWLREDAVKKLEATKKYIEDVLSAVSKGHKKRGKEFGEDLRSSYESSRDFNG